MDWSSFFLIVAQAIIGSFVLALCIVIVRSAVAPQKRPSAPILPDPSGLPEKSVLVVREGRYEAVPVEMLGAL